MQHDLLMERNIKATGVFQLNSNGEGGVYHRELLK